MVTLMLSRWKRARPPSLPLTRGLLIKEKPGGTASFRWEKSFGCCQVSVRQRMSRLWFILYINDICKVSKLLKLVLFADDTNIFCSGDDLAELLKDLTEEMIKLKNWFDYNKLSLNLAKTKIMLFGYGKRDGRDGR